MSLLVAIVVAATALVQSLFGVGILAFGTPTLLLMDVPFAEALGVLLPASLTMSLLQIWRGSGADRGFVRAFAVAGVPPLIVGLSAVLIWGFAPALHGVIGAMLALFVVQRLVPDVGGRARAWLVRHTNAWMSLAGLVHGLSNLGGPLVLMLASARSTDRHVVRTSMATAYAGFAASQLAVLGLLTPAVLTRTSLFTATVSAVTFLAVGDRIFRGLTGRFFERALTALAGVYAAVLGARAAGVL